MVIGYYVHHHGAGHLTRARIIASVLRDRGDEVVLLGSDLRDTAGVTLPRDNEESLAFTDPTADGALHWAPLRHPGYSARMEILAAWVKTHKPAVVVVDVSVEVVGLMRLLGVPTVVLAQPGDRFDDAHTLAYRCATAILAPWPAEAVPCPALVPFAHKVTHVGGISGVSAHRRTPDVGVVLTGRGEVGDDSASTRRTLTQELEQQVPHVRWVEAGPDKWVDDIGSLLARAHVVVTHCGQNAVADVAALDVPAVLCPSPRPHDEQIHMGSELARLGYAQVADPQAEPSPDWSSLVERALRRPSRWAQWGTAAAPSRAAEMIQRVANG